MNRKITRMLCAALLLLTGTEHAKAQGPKAYTLFDSKGKEVSYQQMIDQLAGCDVVFFGENHNCPIAHWMELNVARSLYERHGDKLVIGEEMMEADNQLILDEYMNSQISYDRFEAETRLWDNYSTDYYPVVYFAKENNIPLIATNVPRRYANVVKNKGLLYLDSLSEEARRYLPPLPVPFEYDEGKSSEAFGLMQLLGGRTKGDTRLIAEAQAIKDATMAWFIARNLKHKFLHINGRYHSDSRDGIIPYLLKYRPGTTIGIITTIRQESVEQLDEENLGLADFYICVPEDMVTSY
ncbi:MAG: ChaN family lipoprotein [Paraprevotella sp.]|nr:ChaN family lipoprotein [Paraprevotella sp.]